MQRSARRVFNTAPQLLQHALSRRRAYVFNENDLSARAARDREAHAAQPLRIMPSIKLTRTLSCARFPRANFQLAPPRMFTQSLGAPTGNQVYVYTWFDTLTRDEKKKTKEIKTSQTQELARDSMNICAGVARVAPWQLARGGPARPELPIVTHNSAPSPRWHSNFGKR